MRILIIGGGIAGAAAGIKLVEKGWEVEIWEEHKLAGEPRHCTGLISDNGITFLSKSFGINVPVIKKYEKAKLFFENCKIAELVSKKGYWLVDRAELDKRLIKQAEKRGARIIFIKRFSKQDVSYVLNNYDVIVGADGPFSTTARVFSFPPIKKWIHTNRFSVKTTTSENIHLYLSRAFKGFFGWLVPNNDETEFGCGSTSYPNIKTVTNFMRKIGIKQWKSIPSRPIPLSPRKITAKRVNDKLIFLIGDAAGHIKPLTGGGIIFGTRCAEHLATAIEKQSITHYESLWRSAFSLDIYAQELMRRTLFTLGEMCASLKTPIKLISPRFIDTDFPIFHIRQQIFKAFYQLILSV